MEKEGHSHLECGECDRLLEAYIRRTREYLDLMRRRKAAFLERCQSTLREIDSQLQAESERRAFAKRDLLRHDLIHREWGR
jgi:hypothetical protein